MVKSRFDYAAAVFVLCMTILILFIMVPIVSIFLTIPGGDVVAEVTNQATMDAIKLSLFTSTSSLVIIMLLGTPTARALARNKMRGKKFIDSIIDLPIVLPPAVAGIALLFAFAPRSPIGSILLSYGIILPGSLLAVVLAQTFVALPFYVRSARTAFEEINPRLEMAASTLSPSQFYSFRRIVLPLASRGLIAGGILAWGRAMGEFGATLLFAGNLPGITQTMPLAIYVDMASDIYKASLVAGILIVISFSIIVSVRYLSGGKT